MVGFQNPEVLALLVLALPGIYFALKADEKYKLIVNLSHTLLIVLLVGSAASPYINVTQSVKEQPEIVVLRDESTSSQLLEDTELEFEDIKLREKVIASGNSSDLRHGILRNLEPNTAYLAVSDFQSSTPIEEISEKFQKKNSTLSALKPGTTEEASVTIKGPSSTVPGAKNKFRIEVHSTDETPRPRVFLDGSRVPVTKTSEGGWKFTESFPEKGNHRLEASIPVNDRHPQNNRYYHAIEVIRKPRVLVLGEKGKLGEKLSRFYRVEHSSKLPGDLSPYYTIIMKKDPSRGPVSYVSKGNGVVYTAGYEKPLNILPVKSIPEKEQNKGAKIVLAIDISEGTEGGTAGLIKKIAYNLVEKLPYNNRVGAVAYSEDAYVISRPEPLAENRNLLKQKIARLKPSGPSFHNNGIRGAKRMLDGKGNIILISDGKVGGLAENRDVAAKTRSLASTLDVKLITVGVGDGRNREFLEDLAERGSGAYLDAGDTGKLQFRFESGGASGETVPLVTVDPNHFITDGMELSSAATFFDPVEPRKGADLLVTGTDGRPLLTTWRYGIGRVAAFSGGDKELSEITRLDPLLLTRTVSWTVGDPKRKQDKWLSVESARRPGKAEVRASYPVEGLKRQSGDLYTRQLKPESPGFHTVREKVYGYNYNPELEEIGYSDRMRQVVRATGGEVYKPGEKKEIARELKRFSRKKVVTKKNLGSYLLALALLVFLAEVGYRKMNGKK